MDPSLAAGRRGNGGGRGLRELLFRRAIFKRSDETRQVREFLGVAPGIFVEVGANDPVKGSQTYALEQAGWAGVLIEPLAECAARLREARRAQVFEVAAGAPEDDGKQLPLIVAGALSTLMPSIIQRDVQAEGVRYVTVRTLDSILTEAGVGRPRLISIDVEGAQYAAVRGLSLDRFGPDLLLVEDDVHELDTHRHLSRRGYKLVRRTALNNWYVPRSTPFVVSVFGQAQLFRKLHLGRWLRRARRRHQLRRQAMAG